MEWWCVEMHRKEYDSLWMFLHFSHPFNLFPAVKITTTYPTRMHRWTDITWYTRWPRYVDLNRDAWYVEPALVGAAFCTLLEPESMSESHLSVTFIAAGIVRSCQSTLVRAMLFGARIVWDHARATLVRATLVTGSLLEPKLWETVSEHTFIAGIIRDNVQATLNKATLIWPGLLDHSRAAHLTVEWRWLPGSVAWSISWVRYRSSQDGRLLLIFKSNQVILSMYTLPLVDEHISSVCLLHPNMLPNGDCNLRTCYFEITLLEWWELPVGVLPVWSIFVYILCQTRFYTKEVVYIMLHDMIVLI